MVPDELVLNLLKHFLANLSGTEETSSQELYGRQVTSKGGYILDGFPRTVKQAEELSKFQDINLVLNLFLREDVLIEKCLGRRLCTKCNGNYNIADIYRAPENGKPEIVMPPLAIPESCEPHITIRKDDTVEIITKRLDIYKAEAEPLENFYKSKDLLVDFEITGGIDHTMPVLSPAVVTGLQ